MARPQHPSQSFEQNNIQLTTDQEKANVLNTFFHSCFNTALPPLSCTDACPEPSGSPERIFCTEEEILEMILNLDASKASGPGEISVRMIRGTAPSIASILAQIFNTSIKTGKIPSVWKASYIVSIPKGTNSSTDPSGFWPISLLSVVSKLLEKIIHNRVLASLQETCPPPTNQWGFLPERSTSGALLAATHDWLTELDKGNISGCSVLWH